MANQEHLYILKKGVTNWAIFKPSFYKWNKWRDKNSEIRPDLSGAYLAGAKLYEANLSGADLSGANLYEAKVSDEEIADCNILFGATMPDGNRYDGRFNLYDDIELARKEDIDPDNAEAMARWYAGDD